MADENAEIGPDSIEMAVPSGVLGGTSLVRPDATLETPLTEQETAKFEKLLGKPGAHGEPKPPGEGRSVLIAEDDPHMRHLVALMVEGLKCRPLEVGDGGNALKALVKFKVDLLVLDLKMPVMDGFAVLRGIRSYMKLADLPILVISGAGKDSLYELTSLDLGADNFLQKPFGLPRLKAHIKAMLRRTVSAG